MAVYSYGITTDRGDVRPDNQDSVLCRTGTVGAEQSGLFVVADGMGGLAWGAQVSAFITEQFAGWWQNDLPELVENGQTSEQDIRELLEQEIWDINQAILAFRRRGQCRCGSTLSLLLLYGGNYYIENLGDSRIYMAQHGIVRQLTQDQSLVAQLVREGQLTKEEAEHSARKNMLTMCMGMFDVPQSYFASGRLKSGDVFLLCSDGLYNPMDKEQMEQVLAHRELAVQKRVEMLRCSIAPGEARDNVSAVLVEVLP